MNEARTEENAILALLESTASESSGAAVASIYDEAVDRLVTLWVHNRNNEQEWPSDFVDAVRELLKSAANRHGFQAYVGKCESLALRSMQDGFRRSCYYRSHIQVVIEEFVPFAALVHPADVESLADIDEIYVDDANQIPPIPPEDIPSWVPESHWWWRAPTRLDMSQQEIDEKLNDYHPEDWETP